MFVCYECCVLSGRGLCDELITRPEECYRLWCVVVCDLEKNKPREWGGQGLLGGYRDKIKKIVLNCSSRAFAASRLLGTVVFCLGMKQPECELSLSPTCRAAVEKEWSRNLIFCNRSHPVAFYNIHYNSLFCLHANSVHYILFTVHHIMILGKWPTCTNLGHQHRMPVTRGCIDTICLSWWWARCARNM